MKRDLIVTADGRDRAVSVEGPLADGRFKVSIDGAERLVDARPVKPGTWSIVLADRAYLVDLDHRKAAIAATVGTGEVSLVVEDAMHRKLAQAAGPRGTTRGESIRAPIAGKVVKVLVEVGAVVEPGTPVIVLEAMKMENELVAERGGTVGAIHKAAGQAVETGDLLVELG